MIVKFKINKPITFHFIVSPSEEREYLCFSEDEKYRCCFLKVGGFERLKEVMDAIKKYAETHIFSEEMEGYSLNDVLNNYHDNVRGRNS